MCVHKTSYSPFHDNDLLHSSWSSYVNDRILMSLVMVKSTASFKNYSLFSKVEEDVRLRREEWNCLRDKSIFVSKDT